MNIKEVKKLKKYFKKNIKNKLLSNLYTIVFLFFVVQYNFTWLDFKNNQKEIKLLINNLFNHEEQHFEKILVYLKINHQDKILLEKILEKYLNCFNEAKQCEKITYDFHAHEHKIEIFTNNNQYMNLFQQTKDINQFIKNNLKFNFSILIEFIRDSLIEVINE